MMRTVSTVEELKKLPEYTVIEVDGYHFAAVFFGPRGDRVCMWDQLLTSAFLSTGELLSRHAGPFEVVASPEPDGLHELAEACMHAEFDDWRRIAEQVSEEKDPLVANVARGLVKALWAVKHNYGEVERARKQTDEAHKRVAELERQDEPRKSAITVDGWSRQQWLDHAGVLAKKGQTAHQSLAIAEAMREGTNG